MPKLAPKGQLKDKLNKEVKLGRPRQPKHKPTEGLTEKAKREKVL